MHYLLEKSNMTSVPTDPLGNFLGGEVSLESESPAWQILAYIRCSINVCCVNAKPWRIKQNKTE